MVTGAVADTLWFGVSFSVIWSRGGSGINGGPINTVCCYLKAKAKANQDSLHLTCREATHSDYDAVMNIASVDTFRDGFDFLPAKFHQWVDDPDIIMVVGKANDKVLGLFVCVISGGGANLLNKFIRMDPELWGKKYMGEMAFQLEKSLLRLHPRLLQLERHGLDVMYFQGKSNEVLDSLETKDVLPSPPHPPVVPCQPSDMARLARPEFSQQVLVDNNIFVDWDPYQLSASNLRGFSERGVIILVDTGRACHEYEGMITFCVMLIDPSLKTTSKTFCVEKLGLVHLPHDHSFGHNPPYVLLRAVYVQNVGKRRASVRGEYRLRTESCGFGSMQTRPYDARNRSRPDVACRPHSYTLRNHASDVRVTCVHATPSPRFQKKT
ncbi:histidine N-acetyltransferase [Branchiostoma belcheri]|nr:histidine N-acetyltransferase [Branchiostoma belcheri]